MIPIMPQQFARSNADLIAGDVLKTLPVRREYLGLGDITDIAAVLVHHRQIPGLGCIELIHHAVHTVCGQDGSGSVLHQGIDLGCLILVLVEHDLADIIQTDVAAIDPGIVQDGIEVAGGTGHCLDQISQSVIQPDGSEVRLHQIRGLEKGQDGPVAVVGNQVSTLGETLGIYGKRLKGPHRGK